MESSSQQVSPVLSRKSWVLRLQSFGGKDSVVRELGGWSQILWALWRRDTQDQIRQVTEQLPPTRYWKAEARTG